MKQTSKSTRSQKMILSSRGYDPGIFRLIGASVKELKTDR